MAVRGGGDVAGRLRVDRGVAAARASGDEAGVRRATEALRSSHGWRVLRDLDRAGDWSEVFWEYADEVAAGTVRAGYVQALDCR